MAEEVHGEGKKMSRRDFLTILATGAAAGTALAVGAEKILGENQEGSQTKKVTQFQKDVVREVHTPENSEPTQWSGKVEEGESLTNTLERISGTEMSQFANFGLAWKHGEITYHFEDIYAFKYQDAVPLPFTWAGDEVTVGKRDDIKDLVYGDPDAKVVDIKSRTRSTDNNVHEVTLMVSGSRDREGKSDTRFDRDVFFKLKEDRSGWEVNTKADKWVDASVFKDLMNSNPDMTASVAFEQLQ